MHGQDGSMGSSRGGLRKRYFFLECFPYVCPEPVLGNDRFYAQMAQKEALFFSPRLCQRPETAKNRPLQNNPSPMPAPLHLRAHHERLPTGQGDAHPTTFDHPRDS
jgi:hypothetical protein